MRGGLATPFKTAHGILVSTQGKLHPQSRWAKLASPSPWCRGQGGRRNSLPPTAIGALPSRPNYEAYPPLCIPIGTGVPTSLLGADHSLPTNHQRTTNQVARPGRGNANSRGGRGPGDQGKPSPKIPPHIVPMSKDAGKAAAILLGCIPTFPINCQSLVNSGLTVHKQDYSKVLVDIGEKMH